MFRRLLIANRGEIAARIRRACDELGIEAVMAHSAADAEAPWVRGASRRLCIGPARPADSYLNAGAILQAAEQCECQAIHPGYDFLAENATFAARCEQQGITFVGPSAGAIRRMGDKVEAKRTLGAAGLPTIPGSEGALDDLDHARRVAHEIGFPVLLKAVAGGGGRGMRRCEDLAGLEGALDPATREAEAAFGDPRLYMEKLIVGGRHVEFQILCDAFGDAVHLGERECSIQRKHQKLVEETPSPIVDPQTRGRLGESVARAVAGAGYRGAGTVEFLRDPSGRFYFMELNARLQVEHPVTEAVTGVDLVQEQLRIAANQPLRLRQEEIRIEGHAIEFRINAEDPERDFRPTPGELTGIERPRGGAGVVVRWDSAVEPGYVIPPHYDSMIGKLIVSGPTRQAVLDGAPEALRSLDVQGVSTTIGLHLALLETREFREGDYDVDYLSRSPLLSGRA